MDERNNKIKKQSTLRLIIQCISFAFHNGYINGWLKGKIYSGSNKAFCVPGLNCYSCPGAVGACPIGSLQAVLDGAGFHLSLYVFGFIGIVGVFCGRFVCGWLCPFGLVQDLVHKIPLFKKKKNMPGHKYLRYLRFVILAVFVIALPIGVKNQAGVGQPWFCEFICPSGTLLGGIPLVAANASLQKIIGFRFFWKIFLLVLILVGAIAFDRPFCKYVCPLGALYGLANPISIYRYKVDKEKCVQCGACQAVCGGDIKVWETPNSIDCIRCGKCKAACPTGALTTTFDFTKKSSDTTTLDTDTSDVINENVPECEVNQTNTMSTGQRIKTFIAALLALAVSGIATYLVLLFIYLYVDAGTTDNALSYAKSLYSYIVLLVPAVMTFIFGIRLIISGVKGEGIDELRIWGKRILITIGICAAVAYVGNVIIGIMLYGEFGVELLLAGIQLMLLPLIFFVALAVTNLIERLLIK